MKSQFRNTIFRMLIIYFILINYSCDDFVDIDQPNSQLTTQAVFENSITATAAMTDIYAQMRENGVITGRINGFSCLFGAYSDELISYESGIYTTAGFYTNSLLPSNNYVESIWDSSYSQIYATNSVIEGVENSESLQSDVKNQLKGEALFIRAFLHFHLVNIFGDIPYITTTDYNQNSTVTRMETEIVYQNIITDIEESIDLIGDAYISPERTRPNKVTAQALLARVYLYNGNYSGASNIASVILNDNANYILEENLDHVFVKNNTSTIWQLSPGANGANTYEGTSFIFFEGPPNKVSLATDFVSQFGVNDLRRAHWIKEVTNGSEIWYHSFKYKQDNITGSSLEYSIVFRLEEQYLIRAEAKARGGDLTGAKEDLNKIRNRAGLLDIEAGTQADLLEAILEERKFELFTEHGHRFFDLKRFGKLDEILGTKQGWNTTDQLWPIPLNELLSNPYLTPQNPGY